MKNQYEIDYQQGYDKANDEWLDKMDKIRAEIEQKLNTHGTISLYNKAINDVLQIIDKYKADRSEEE